MIRKFQLGGQQLQLLNLIFDMINKAPEEALKQLAQSGAKPEDISKIVQLGVQQGKIKPEIGQAIMLAIQGQVKKSLHGSKLQYVRSLKNQCPEGEELYYYKKGGSVGCGCKKKEDGGEMKPKKDCGGGAVAKFKMRKAEPGMKMMLLAEANKERKKKKAEQEKKKNTWGANSKIVGKDIQRGSGNDTSEQEKKDKSAKDYYKGVSYHTIMADKCGSKVVKKFKKHYRGGILNFF